MEWLKKRGKLSAKRGKPETYASFPGASWQMRASRAMAITSLFAKRGIRVALDSYTGGNAYSHGSYPAVQVRRLEPSMMKPSKFKQTSRNIK